MKSLKHFCYAFLHLFTFALLIYFQSNLEVWPIKFSGIELWFMALITIVNVIMAGMHLEWMIKPARLASLDKL